MVVHMIVVPNYTRGQLLFGGRIRKCNSSQDLGDIVHIVKGDAHYGGNRLAFVQDPDKYLYSVQCREMSRIVILRLRTRENPHLSLGDVRKDSRVYYDFFKAVDKKRHVIMGEKLEGDKPDWLLEYELEELFYELEELFS
jgi:hypothetical protein